MRIEVLRMLSEEQRGWLYRAVAKLVLIDERLDNTEQNEVNEVMQALAGSLDMMDVQDLMRSESFSRPLTAPREITPERAWALFVELVRTAVVDARLATAEKAYLNNIMDCLGFAELGREPIFQWIELMAKAHSIENGFAVRLNQIIPQPKA